jgi:ribonuclease III
MSLSALEKKLGHRFRDKSLLAEACRHSSFVNEQPGQGLRDNERLEFLGDAVLNLTVSHLLMHRFPDTPEGSLSRMRANLVNETQLATIARSLGLGGHLLLGKGEVQSQGRRKKSILADAFEAVAAAIYLDGGYDAAFRFIKTHFSGLIQDTRHPRIDQDFKSQLQEFVQIARKGMPVYRVVTEKGPDHDKTFEVEIRVCDIAARGEGKSKKTAEQDAARKALLQLHVR